MSKQIKDTNDTKYTINQEYQHKGPIHVGKLIIDFRSYAWTLKPY